jgi:hypothetical protein
MSGLDDSGRIEVSSMIKDALEDCPMGVQATKEMEHINKSIQNMEEVDKLIFEKLGKQDDKLETTFNDVKKSLTDMGDRFIDKIDGIKNLLLAGLISGAGALVVGIVLFVLNTYKTQLTKIFGGG